MTARCGSRITSVAAAVACAADIPCERYMPASSEVSAWELCMSSRSSRAISRSTRSFWALTDTHSPAAMLAAPATADATPASRTTSPPKPLAAKPMMSDTLVTRPSLSPKIPARAVPPARARWSGWSSCSARAVSVMAQSYSRCEVLGRA